ncbi:40S ribosomal protein S20 [Porphyridium purpureum]|uniref:Small ribosomal subunit protein uS10 n=1 Tax=Porphyridium purpureum TaxID=35688 RepID=A0A5J4ZA17_PORPP|nr:40S ribosomal protein S20 [Porphyridium purpureum]|eukprot:POR6239..scf295_1
MVTAVASRQVYIGKEQDQEDEDKSRNKRKMADLKKPGLEAEVTQHKIRITLTSKNVRALEKTCSDLVRGAREKEVTVRGPVRMPTKKLMLMVRKSPCGNGTNTYDRFEMRIHKRLIDLHASTDVVKQITSIKMEEGVEVQVDVM